MKTPDIFYLVAVDFPELGFGSGGDITANFEDAVDQYTTHDNARVFRLEMDANNMPAGFFDVTGDAEDVIAHRLGIGAVEQGFDRDHPADYWELSK